MNIAEAEELARMDYQEIEKLAVALIPTTTQPTVLVDGSAYAPSYRAMTGGARVFESDDFDAQEAYRETFDKLCMEFGETHDFYGIDWFGGTLCLEPPEWFGSGVAE